MSVDLLTVCSRGCAACRAWLAWCLVSLLPGFHFLLFSLSASPVPARQQFRRQRLSARIWWSAPEVSPG